MGRSGVKGQTSSVLSTYTARNPSLCILLQFLLPMFSLHADSFCSACVLRVPYLESQAVPLEEGGLTEDLGDLREVGQLRGG